jgi:hypothetical protein
MHVCQSMCCVRRWWQVQCIVSTRVNLFTSKRKHNKVFLCLWCVVCLLDWVYCVVVVVESTSSPLCCLNNFLICDWKNCIAYRGNRIHRYSMNISFLENFPENFVWLFFFSYPRAQTKTFFFGITKSFFLESIILYDFFRYI